MATIRNISRYSEILQQNAKRKLSMQQAMAVSENTRSAFTSVSTNKVSGLVALTEQILRSKAAAKAATDKAAAVKAAQELNKLA